MNDVVLFEALTKSIHAVDSSIRLLRDRGYGHGGVISAPVDALYAERERLNALLDPVVKRLLKAEEKSKT